MPTYDVYLDRKAKRVLEDTWGHLSPKKGMAYHGYIIFAESEWGSIGTCLIRAKFTDLPDSPWFFEDLNNFIGEQQTEPGKIYRFDGTYIKFKNDNYRFSGKTREIPT